MPPRFNNLELIETYEFTDPNLSCERNTTYAIIYYRIYGRLGGTRVFTVQWKMVIVYVNEDN